MLSNRRALAVAAVALLLTTSGCIGFLTGDEALAFEAETAAVDETVVQNAGYESNGTRTVAVNRTFDVAGQERRVVAENRLTSYEKSLDFGPLGEAKLAQFTVVSTPAVEIAGRTMNPIGSYSNARLVEFVQQRYSGIGDVERVSERNVTVQGTETAVTKFSATATMRGVDVPVYVHVTKFRSGDDFVLALGIYPQQLDGEESNVLEMTRAIEHPASD